MRILSIAAAAGVVVLAACGDSGPAGTSQVAFGLATQTAAPTLTSGFMATQTFTDLNGDTLDLDSAFVVVRKLQLEGGPTNSICSLEHPGTPDSMMASADSMGEDDCGELKFGPFLVELPMNGAGAAQQFTATVDTGTYAEVKFQIHKPEGSSDAAFLAAHPEYAGVSLRVVGRWNGTPFVYTTGVTDVQHVEFNPPLVIGEAPASFTLFVDLTGWFRTSAGVLVDPSTALSGGANAELVHQNIIRSFRAFEDDNHDGHDDHSGT